MRCESAATGEGYRNSESSERVKLPYYILLGDIGATNARFALVSNGNLNAALAHLIVCVCVCVVIPTVNFGMQLPLAQGMRFD
jgi:hypothetical protein